MRGLIVVMFHFSRKKIYTRKMNKSLRHSPSTKQFLVIRCKVKVIREACAYGMLITLKM